MKSFISCSTVARLLLFLSIPWSVLIDPIGGQPSSSTNDHHQHRRSPMGFQGVRGRRSPFGEPLGYYSEASDPNNTTADEASALSPAQSVVGAVFSTEETINASAEALSQEHNYNRASPPLSLTKRASRGFFGMRGKKDFELVEDTLPIDSTEKAEEELWQNHQDDQHSLNKRIKVYPAVYTISPQHTTTTRKDSDIMVVGKYAADDEEQDSLVKKNQQSFPDTWTVPSNRLAILSDYKDQKRFPHQALDYGDLNRLLDDQSEVYRPKIQFAVENNSPTASDEEEEAEDEDDITIGRFVEGLYYQEPRSKKLFFNLPYRYIPKRTPSGFMGMRGKKLMESSYKRGPSGFMGMRGKKSSWDPLYELLQNYENNDLDDEVEKRAPASGFFGMRGKKWTDLGVDEVDKRSPSMGFFGMRGKKENGNYVSSRFNSLEGAKRSPQMGFHGMRGKRSVDHERSRGNNYGLFSVMKKAPYDFRGKFIGVRGKKSEQNVFNQYVDAPPIFEKRAPNGFMGMRGKKS